ncbi:M16 family metallopeptidase [Thermodesulfobacteriota bacterium]
MIQKTILSNELRVVTKHLPGLNSATVIVLVGAGSRLEEKKENGISHFLEHMFFKGGEKYKDTKEVAEAIDSIGGEFNAFTGKQYVGYYVKTSADNKEVSFDVLSDMLFHAKFDKKDIEKEKGVIVEEINMYEDLPMEKVSENYERLVYGDTSFGWSIAGSKDNVTSFTQSDLLSYKEKYYFLNNIIISAAGDVEHKAILKLTEKYFPFPSTDKQILSQEFQGYTEEDLSYTKKDTEQSHLVFGVSAPAPKSRKERYVGKLFSTILGGNMSSRMFLEIREKQGLCYYIHSYFQNFKDNAYFATSAGVDVKRVKDAIISIKKEYEKVKEKGVSEEEVKKARAFYKGKLLLSLENTEAVARLISSSELIYNESGDISEIIKVIESISKDDIDIFARNLFSSRFRLALIGPGQNDKALYDLLK